jgi:hypothetical protein
VAVPSVVQTHIAVKVQPAILLCTGVIILSILSVFV